MQHPVRAGLAFALLLEPELVDPRVQGRGAVTASNVGVNCKERLQLIAHEQGLR